MSSNNIITTILSDFSRVILFPKDPAYKGSLNNLNTELSAKYGSYQFSDYFVFNEQLLALYASLKSKYSLNIFTTGTIQNHPEVLKRIDSIFENVYTAKDFNLSKKSNTAYIFIANKLGKDPQEIVFIDDTQNNLEAASAAGMHTIRYTDYQQLEKELNRNVFL